MRGKLDNKKIETTFGQITVFSKDEPSDRRKSKNTSNHLKAESQESVKSEDSYSSIKQPVNPSKEESVGSVDKDEDFFGIKKSEMNYFDQQLIKSYDASSSKPSDLNTESKKVVFDSAKPSKDFEESLDFVDSQYFGALDPQKSQASSTVPVVPEKHVTKSDVEREFSKGANYVDEQVLGLQKLASADDVNDIDSIGSVRNFKKDKANKLAPKKPAASIPIVQKTNLTEENVKNARLKFKNDKKDNENQLPESEHKTLMSEVPDWSRVTIDEATNILKNHVCYYNAEGFFSSFYLFEI